jgi:hypothetical protein
MVTVVPPSEVGKGTLVADTVAAARFFPKIDPIDPAGGLPPA